VLERTLLLEAKGGEEERLMIVFDDGPGVIVGYFGGKES